MLLARIQDNQVAQVADSSDLFPNVSFSKEGFEQIWLDENKCMLVETHIQHNVETEKLESCTAYIEGDKVYTVKVVDLTKEDIDKRQEQQKNAIRAQRNRLLSESDWTQLADAPVDNLAWAVYRQALRDITLQAGFPNEVTYPEKP